MKKMLMIVMLIAIACPLVFAGDDLESATANAWVTGPATAWGDPTLNSITSGYDATYSLLSVGESDGCVMNAYMKFPCSIPASPSNTVITSATLTLYYAYSSGHQALQNVYIDYAKAPWNVSTLNYSNQPGGIFWPDNHVSPLYGTRGRIAGLPAPLGGNDFAGYYTWDVTGAVKTWFYGWSPNNGIVLYYPYVYDSAKFFGSASASPEYTPQLEIVYGPGTPPAGPPSISSISPSQGYAGDTVTITGQNLTRAKAVEFGASVVDPCTIVVNGAGTQLTCTVPANAMGTYNVYVDDPCTWVGTLANGFTYKAACGELGYLQTDLNHDCRVNFADFAVFAENWTACTDPHSPCNFSVGGSGGSNVTTLWSNPGRSYSNPNTGWPTPATDYDLFNVTVTPTDANNWGMEAWVNLSALNQDGTAGILNFGVPAGWAGGTVTGTSGIWLDASGGYWETSMAGVVSQFGPAVTLNQWVHLASVLQNGTLYFYEGTNPNGSVSLVTTWAVGPDSPSGPIMIGAMNTSAWGVATSRGVTGQVANARIFQFAPGQFNPATSLLPIPSGSYACGAFGYPVGDFNHDCYVNFKDVRTLAQAWLSCNDTKAPCNFVP